MKALFALFLSFAATAVFGGGTADSVALPSLPHALRWENAPLSFAVQGPDLEIVGGPKSNLFRHPNGKWTWDTAPMLLFTPDSDFVLSACVELAFTNKWDAGGLMLRGDGSNWVKFCFEKDYTGAHRVVSVVTKGVSDDSNSVELPGNRVFLKMARSDKMIMLYCSADGSTWLLVRHLSFDTNGAGEVGFSAQSPAGESCTVKFSQIEYRAVKIKDPYAGK